MWMLIVLTVMNVARAQEQKSAFEQSLEHDTAVSSEESWVDIKGVLFRKIEFSGGIYYLHYKDADAKLVELYCEPPFGNQKDRLVKSQPQIFKRSRAFVKIFNDNCSKTKGAKKLEIKVDPSVGLQYPDEIEPKVSK